MFMRIKDVNVRKKVYIKKKNLNSIELSPKQRNVFPPLFFYVKRQTNTCSDAV